MNLDPNSSRVFSLHLGSFLDLGVVLAETISSIGDPGILNGPAGDRAGKTSGVRRWKGDAPGFEASRCGQPVAIAVGDSAVNESHGYFREMLVVWELSPDVEKVRISLYFNDVFQVFFYAKV